MLSCFVLEQGWDGLREKFLCDYRTFDFLCEVHGLLKVSTVYRSFKVFVLKQEWPYNHMCKFPGYY